MYQVLIKIIKIVATRSHILRL